MQSASLSARVLGTPGQLWSGARSSMRGGLVWSAVLVLLLTLSIARSTATAAWVAGMDVVPVIALGGALLMAALAVLPIRWPFGLGFGMILGPIAAGVAAWPVINAAHPHDDGLGVWWTRIADGSAASDPSFYLFLICWLMWVTGAWMSWCVLRWRKTMLGLIPGAAAFAANLLNFPRDQNGYNFTILVLTLALLLWTNYTGSIASATRAHVKLTGDARWDFWESGLVAMAALIVIAIMLPPLSTVDRTLDVESSMFSNWAQLQQRLSHPGIIGVTSGGSGTTGFASDVPLGDRLTRTRDPVFYYSVIGEFTGPRYFRGLNMTTTADSEWRYPLGAVSLSRPILKNQVPVYGEDYQKLALSGAIVTMQRPPTGFSDVLFYPGALYKVDRDAVGMQVALPQGRQTNLTSIDRLSALRPNSSAGKYTVTVEYSTATVADLEAAATKYPSWLQNFTTLPETGYRSPDVQRQIHDLAVQVVTAANATTPYDKATAIQDYLRANYAYTLTPPARPVGMDPLYFFLFRSKKGYCEYFASAMGDMLRSLGIPTRLVNGFGPGAYDATIQSFVVRAQDAHTWDEAYFPGYGWISFEPTPDFAGGYNPIARGSQGQNVCLRESGCDAPSSGSGDSVGVPLPTDRPGGALANDPTGSLSNFSFRMPDAGTLTTVVAVFFALILFVLAGVARYLRPRSVMGVWKRTLALSQLAGAKRRPGETPLELGRRLQQRFPEASEPVGALAGGFAIAAYAPHDEAASARSSVMEAWSTLRPMLVRRVLARLRPNRA
ncbi:MAG TPA: transglutaminase domain-containing protein [Candidatus Nitrosotalea sp.]|nr:transglutaminase domain-containing protein [Candidatus Nitrosotalea sp.]